MDRILDQHNPCFHLAFKKCNRTESQLFAQKSGSEVSLHDNTKTCSLVHVPTIFFWQFTCTQPCKATFVVDYISTWEIFQTMEYTHEEKKGNGHNQLLEWFCCTCHPLHIVKVSIRSDAKGTCTTSQVTHGWVNSDLHCWHMYMFPNKVIVAFSISFLLSSIQSFANIRLAQSCINAENQ